MEKKVKPAPTKTNMYTLNEKNVQKLSRNNSKEPKDLKAKSFLKPTVHSNTSNFRTHLKQDAYSTYINSKTVAGKRESNSSGKAKYSYVNKSKGNKKKPKAKGYQRVGNVRHIQLNADEGTQYKTNYSYKKNLSTMLKMSNKSRGSSNTRNNHIQAKTNNNYYGINRCGSVSYNSSVSSLREAMSSRRRNIRKGQKAPNAEGSLDPPSYKNFLKSRRSLGDNKHTFH
ncbi:MAG: hypothetical protein MO852_03240, partial [Candidatus Devosia euplotis]|nr:hypothetical protein [Candidatus Devosia euplotis]